MTWQALAVEIWGLTEAERVRLAAAPFAGAPADHWRAFSAVIHEKVLEGYAAGEVDLRRVLEVMRACSLGCTATDRIRLMAMTAERALKIRPKNLNRRRPPHPTWVKKSAGDFVRLIESRGLVVTPSEHGDGSAPGLELVRHWFESLELSGQSLTAGTLYDWYLDAKKAAGETPRRGRRPKSPSFST